MSLRVRGKDLVILLCLLAAASWGTWLFVRLKLDLGGGWSDGQVSYQLEGERIRYAVWDTPEPFAAALQTGDDVSRPAISPDGRYLVYAVGQRGLNCDLFVAELTGSDGEAQAARPLANLNSPFDDLAPAFGPDGLYFATDRAGAAFGLDLWRAPYVDGTFGEPEPVGGGINSAADDTDPYPVPGTRDLLFSSNRPQATRTDFELYRATLDHAPIEQPEDANAPADEAARNTERFQVALLEPLNTPFDEREPALTSDGRTLVFASDRVGSRGGFDLFRTFREEGGWLEPEPLVGVNTRASERGPLLSADGFSLYFDAPARDALASDLDPPDTSGLSDLWRARSLELFRVPGPPLSLQEVLLLIALILLALLAWLSKRWRTLDILYKCFLVSLLVHLILMWYLREVYPESGPVDVAGDSKAFRVKLAPSPSGTPAAARERDGELQLEARNVEAPEAAPSRAESGVELAAAAPARHSFQTPERTLEAPARRDAELAENRREAAVEAALEAREEFEQLVQNAPGLALDARESSAAPTADLAENSPNRASTAAASQEPAPSSVMIEVAAQARDSGQTDPERTRLARSAGAAMPVQTAVAQPSESFESARAAAPALSLPEVTVAPAPERTQGDAPERESSNSQESTVLLAEASPSAANLESLAPARQAPEVPAGPSVPTLETRIERGDPAVDLRSVHESPPADANTRESQRFDATAELAQADTVRTATGSSDPTRFEASPRENALQDAMPTRREVRGDRPVRDPEETAPTSRGRTAIDVPILGGSEVAVREVEEDNGSDALVSTPEPQRFEATLELASTQPRRFRPEPNERPRPTRFERETTLEPERFEPRPMPIVAAPAPEPELDDVPRRMEQTPYKNRFGEEKLRALEEFGGGVETERAVAAGLAYLAEIQNRSGSWGERRDRHDKYRDVRIGKTGLSLLAFLGAGHTQEAGTEYEDVAQRAIRFLLDQQDGPTGHFGDSSAYGHGIATYALAECYALTGDENLRLPLERAVAHIVANQLRDGDPRLFGGWGYFFRDGSVWNRDAWPRVSVTAWQVMALESSRIGGLEIDDRVFEAAAQFLAEAWDPRLRAFRYSHDPARLRSGYPTLPASTPAALFGLSILGLDISREELDEARRFVLRRAPRDYSYVSDDAFVENARGNLYFWYYGTLWPCSCAGGDDLGALECGPE